MSRNKKMYNIKYITLPYDFIPFPKKWVSYNDIRKLDNLPRHDQRKQLSGYIQYKLIPQSDLAVEIRKGENFFLAGSQIKGRVRTNAEILSQNYPHFINDAPVLFRDMAGDLKGKYKEKLEIKKGIEKSIRVGFLRRDGEKFYVVPAQKYSSDKFFTSIKEHRLTNMNVTINKGESMLYCISNIGNNEKFKQINEIQEKIDRLNNDIKLLRDELKEDLSDIQDEITEIFMEEFSFNGETVKDIFSNQESEDKKNKKSFDKELEKIGSNLFKKLTDLKSNNKNENLEKFFSKMVERWELKAKVHKIYSEMKRNDKFQPYQRQVFYKKNDNGGIAEIKLNNDGKELMLKGYLFNSTNASSKRSHYFIKEEEQDNIDFIVPQNIIEGYKQNLKKFRDNEIKWFYDIFDDDNYEKLIKENHEGLIVFFKTTDDDKSIKMIGRTPYFKVPYNNTIKDILEAKGKAAIGYADALFGFIPNESKELENYKKCENNMIESYKSRLRFSPMDIKGSFNYNDYNSDDFLLPSPFASANSMYLDQPEGEKCLSTYDGKKPELNGYKYYHILDEVQESKKKPKNILSTKGIIKNDKEDIYLEGKIYFNNLYPDELGLLLLSLDIKELLNSKMNKNFIEENKNVIENSFEQIGGAKPYGYGKVKVNINNLFLEKKNTSFKSLMISPFEEQKNKSEYIDAYITKMNEICENDYFNYLRYYIKSKQEKNREILGNGYNKNSPMAISWYNLSEKVKKGKGYPKLWRLAKEK